MEPFNPSKSNPIDIEKPSRPGLTRINTGDRIKAGDRIKTEDRTISKIKNEPTSDNYDNYENYNNNTERKKSQDINLITSQLEEFFVNSPSDLIDIQVRQFKSDVGDTVLVALVDRDKEMRELFKKNEEYFEMVKHSIFSSKETGEYEWQKFLSILYSPRDLVPDSEWMNKISSYLEMNPQLLANFKEIVGFYDHMEDHLTPPEFNEENEEITYSLVNEEMSEFVDIIAIRDRPQILENILNSYPQFFINAKQALSQTYKRPGSALGGNHLTDDIPLRDFNDLSEHNSLDPLYEHIYEHFNGSPNIYSTSYNSNKNNGETEEEKTNYDEFKRILTCPRNEMSDDEWEIAIYECLDPWPQLVAQFEEIVAYEIRNDEPSNLSTGPN